ncbi:pancreatic triacylglycerol lipase-like isoform X2 [Panulirus ornatus]
MAAGCSPWVWWSVLVVTVASAQEDHQQGFLGHLFARLSDLPVIGNFLRADVHPIYRPLVRQFHPRIGNKESELIDLCFDELGCINTHDDFLHPIHRPLNLPPNRREEINVLLTVHSREDKEGTVVEAVNVSQVLNTSFSPWRKTKIIIHGFLETNTETWMWDMVRALLVYGDFNVVTVDWSGGSQALYSQATANTRVVGLEVAHFINWLKDNLDLDPGEVHIIGHSLGSHTAGYAGERVSGLGRITGLDPAEPFFQYMPPSVRLDPSDALFVDVIHTDADSILNLGAGFGLRQPVGHLDFYPNDGRSQPGCDSLRRVPLTALTDGASLYEGLDAAQKELVACNHFRAPKLFTDSILSQCPYLAFQCRSYSRYLNGECVRCGEDGRHCARMGFHADTWPGGNVSSVSSFYVSTSAGPRYCIYHYRLMLDIAESSSMMSALRGNLRVAFFAEDGSVRDFDLTPEAPKTFSHGRRYTFFVHHYDDLSASSEALIQWTYKTDIFNPMSYCLVFCDTVFPLVRLTFTSVDSIVDDRLRDSEVTGEPREVLMCHQQGLEVVRIASEATVKVVSSPHCLATVTSHERNATHLLRHHNRTTGLLDAGLASLSSLFNMNLV